MARRERQFHVVYRFYRYNDGDGQCGIEERRKSFTTKKVAVGLARQIAAAVAKTLDGEELREVEERTLPCFGYLTDVRVERLLIDRVEVAF